MKLAPIPSAFIEKGEPSVSDRTSDNSLCFMPVLPHACFVLLIGQHAPHRSGACMVHRRPGVIASSAGNAIEVKPRNLK
jgi:hypothetical protein